MPYRLNATTGELDLVNKSSSSGNVDLNANAPLTSSTQSGKTTLSLSTVPVTKGGTGLTSVATNSLLLGSSSGQLKAYQLNSPDGSVKLSVDDTNQVYNVQAAVAAPQTNYQHYSNLSTQQIYNGTFLIVDQDATAAGSMVLASYDSTIRNPVLTIIGDGTHNWQVKSPYSGTTFVFGNTTSTAGSGYIASMNPTDCIQLVAINQNIWTVQILEGNVTVY